MTEFVRSLHDVFAAFGAIAAKPMFGGHGLYHDGLMFALVADDRLYLKADQRSAAAFRERGLQPFAYEKNGQTVRMSYFAAPEEIFDDPEQARLWGRRAFEAALRASKAGHKPVPR
jgi:DNA transformation protein